MSDIDAAIRSTARAAVVTALYGLAAKAGEARASPGAWRGSRHPDRKPGGLAAAGRSILRERENRVDLEATGRADAATPTDRRLEISSI
ncbi:MAG: hypothetical protein ACLQE9_05420 [Roseiarcus sp.]